MKHLSLSLIYTFLLGFCINMQAQEGNSKILQSISSSGESVKVDGVGYLSYTLGQLYYMAVTEPGTGYLNEGVQVPFEIISSSGDSEITLEFKAYPTVIKDKIIIEVPNSEDYSTMTYKFFNTSGDLLSYGKLSGYTTTLFMGFLEPGIYLIKIESKTETEEQEIKSFKIVKN